MSPTPVPDMLALPAGALARVAEPVESVTSVRSAARHMVDHGLDVCPVTSDGRFIGAVSQPDLARALADGTDPSTPVRTIARTDVLTVRPYETGAHVLRQMETLGQAWAVVVDDGGLVVGVVSPARLFNPPRRRNRPKMVGGMATPVGVYLTSGNVSGGAPWWGLVLTGALMATILVAADTATTWLQLQLPPQQRFSPVALDALSFLTFLLFVVALRAIPLSGTHAAEHMTVHAIERGEDLVPEVVARMPRVHPRCGTNYMAGLMLFVMVAFSPSGAPRNGASILLGLLAAFFLWKPVGSFLQHWFTTRPPTAAQVQTGIRAGEDLLANYEKAPQHVANPLQRILNSGIPYVVLGGWAASFAIYLVELVLRFPAPWRVSW